MDDRPPPYAELLDPTRRQARRIDDLHAAVERLQTEVEQARRAGKRQAAPVSKGPPKAYPGRSGREPGHPPSHRPAPPPGPVDRAVEVPLPPECPGCHAPRDGAPVTARDRYQIDLPEPEPIVARFRVPVTRGPACFRRVRGRHPEQTSDASGAAAVPYGPRRRGSAADPKHRIGASYRKCSSALLTPTGLAVASAAPVRSGHRLRRLALPRHDRLVEAARPSAGRHVDETGWKIGGRSAWLGACADAHATPNRIRPSRGHEVVVEALGEGYRGVLVGDCFLAYDPLNFAQSKGSAHLLKRCSEPEQSKTRGAVRFRRRVAALLRRAMALKRRRGAIGDRGSGVPRGEIHAELDRLPAGTYTDPDRARPAKLLREHRDGVPRFLDRGAVDATNDLAEREGRPAVIARKLSAGNRTEAGAETHAVPAGEFRTYRRRGRDILAAAVALRRRGPGHVREFDQIAMPVPAM